MQKLYKIVAEENGLSLTHLQTEETPTNELLKHLQMSEKERSDLLVGFSAKMDEDWAVLLRSFQISLDRQDDGESRKVSKQQI